MSQQRVVGRQGSGAPCRTLRVIAQTVAVVLAILGGPAMARDTAKQDSLLDSIQKLSEAKGLAETRVKLLRGLVTDGELTNAELRPIQATYDSARTRVNASFDRILVELESTSRAASTESFEVLAQRASDEVQKFLEESDAVILGDNRSAAGIAAVEAAPGLFGSMVDIWKTLRGEKKEQRAALVARVESLKWDAFEAIQ